MKTPAQITEETLKRLRARRCVQRVVSPLPCPFCGGTKITVEWEHCPPLDDTDTNRRWFAECATCCCQGPFCQKEPQVIPAWNKRANDAAHRAADHNL